MTEKEAIEKLFNICQDQWKEIGKLADISSKLCDRIALQDKEISALKKLIKK